MQDFQHIKSVSFFGAAHIDRLGKTFDAPIAGKSNPGTFKERVGGAALNTASLMALAGSEVSLTTIIGNDSAGTTVARTAQQRGITFEAQTGEQTASYTALLAPDGDLMCALADMEIYNAFETPSIPSGCVCVVDANLPADTLAAIAHSASTLCAISVSISKVQRLAQILPHIDLLFGNEGEILALADEKDDMAKALAALMQCGVKTVIASAGDQPVWIADQGTITRINVPPVRNIVDVTGAGDALAAFTLTSLMNDQALSAAVEVGIAASNAVLHVDGPYLETLPAAL